VFSFLSSLFEAMVAFAAVFVADDWSCSGRYAVVRCSKILYSEGAT
jgi:hypothetical protein